MPNPFFNKYIRDPYFARDYVKRRILLECDSKGLVTWVFSIDSHQHYYMTKQLYNNNIRDFFHIPDEISLDKLADQAYGNKDDLLLSPGFERYIYPSKNTIERMDEACDFYSIIPYSRIYLRQIDDNSFMGEVDFFHSGSFATFEYIRHNPIILIDKNENICGFNSAFARNFNPTFSNPAEFIGKSVYIFLSRSPYTLLRTSAEEIDKARHLDWTLQSSIKCSGKEILEKFFTCSNPDSITISGNDLQWSSKGNSESFLTMRHPIDITAYDIMIEVEYELVDGLPPNIIIAGDNYSPTSLFPDYRGYQLGYHAFEPTIFIKKRGYVMDSRAMPLLPKGKSLLNAFKTGQILSVSYNNVFETNIYDEETNNTMGRHSALFLRGGSTVLLSKINVYTRRTTRNPDKTASEISFLNNRENTYRIRRLNTNHLATISGLPAQGFMFEDISLFRQRIHRLEEEYSREQAEKKRLQGMLEMRRENRLLMIGKSDKLSSIREKVELLAGTNATILIEGETGTGKDVLARYIHEVSESENAPFIKVDCSSIPPTLIESELFGHKKGAFTGAIDNRRGKFELANGGTIFLDEVSNIPIDVQVKLLGVLQDLTVQPIGGSRPVHLNVRIISASNRNLQELVNMGKFREDLYYRLNVIRFVLPPLRERKEDIPVLANYFLESLCKEYKKSEMQFSPESYRLLDTYNWSGNIRELRAVIQKAVLFSTGEAINPSDLQLTNQSTVTTAVPIKRGEKRILHNLPDEELKALLMRNNGIVYKSAMALGVTRKALYDHLRKKGFPIDTFRKGQT